MKFTDSLRLQCALEALKAHGNTNRCADWFRKWDPEYLREWGVTTMQYSMSCIVMEHAVKLIEEEKDDS